MKILYLTVNRTGRIFPYYRQIAAAIRQVVPTDVDERNVGSDPVQYAYNALEGVFPPQLHPPTINAAYDVVITDAIWAYPQEDWMRITPLKVLLQNDVHGPLVARYMAATALAFDLILYNYRDAAKELLPRFIGQWTPLCFDPPAPDVPPKKGKAGAPILMSGTINGAYPVRQAVDEALEGTPEYTRIVRPTDYTDGQWPVGAEYQRMLSRSKIAVSCCSRYGYPVLKMYEILASGAVLATDECPEMKDLGFVPYENYLPIRSTKPTDIRRTFKRWLERPDLETIAHRGKTLLYSRHTAAIRAGEIIQQIKAWL